MDFPILSSLILLPVLGALFIFFSKSKSNNNLTIKYLALFVSFANFILSLYLWYLFDSTTSEFQFLEERLWIKGFINYKVGVDGISNLIKIISSITVKFQNGFIYHYAFVMLLGFSALLTFLILK